MGFDAVAAGVGSGFTALDACGSVFTVFVEVLGAAALDLPLRSRLLTLGLVMAPYLRGASRGSSLAVYSATALEMSERRERSFWG